MNTKKVQSPYEYEWVNVEDRKVLEELDKRLVDVIDTLMVKIVKQSDQDNSVQYNNNLIDKIERRLYIFPFICIQQRELHNQVIGFYWSYYKNLTHDCNH
jgi:disulfide oxidoreductase YuzD